MKFAFEPLVEQLDQLLVERVRISIYIVLQMVLLLLGEQPRGALCGLVGLLILVFHCKTKEFWLPGLVVEQLDQLFDDQSDQEPLNNWGGYLVEARRATGP